MDVHAALFFNDTATTEIYTLSLHDALPILISVDRRADAGELVRRMTAALAQRGPDGEGCWVDGEAALGHRRLARSEEHTSELQSLTNLVCRLLLEKKKRGKPHRRR